MLDIARWSAYIKASTLGNRLKQGRLYRTLAGNTREKLLFCMKYDWLEMTLGFSAFLYWFWSAVFAEGMGWDVKKCQGKHSPGTSLVCYISSSIISSMSETA